MACGHRASLRGAARLRAAAAEKPGPGGLDLAGVVTALGRNVRSFAPGDAVFGTRRGSYAEYVADDVAGRRVMVIGAGGGVGTFAVQLGKVQGAHVTAV